MPLDRIDRALRPTIIAFLIAGAVILAAILLLGTAPHLHDAAGDLSIFDMRFNGYDYTEAVELLEALGSDGRVYYATAQLITDTIFIPFLFLSIASLFLWLTRPGERFAVPLSPNLRLVVVAVAFVGAASDFVENVMVWVMLNQGSEPSTAAASAASQFSTMKWLALSAAIAALVATVIVALIRGASAKDSSSAKA